MKMNDTAGAILFYGTKRSTKNGWWFLPVKEEPGRFNPNAKVDPRVPPLHAGPAAEAAADGGADRVKTVGVIERESP